MLRMRGIAIYLQLHTSKYSKAFDETHHIYMRMYNVILMHIDSYVVCNVCGFQLPIQYHLKSGVMFKHWQDRHVVSTVRIGNLPDTNLRQIVLRYRQI